MRFSQTELCGAWLIEPVPARDHRGFFARTFCVREYEERGLTTRFVQHNVIVDLRPESPTYRRWQGFELTADNYRQLYIPEGFVHGFQSLCDDAEVGYLISQFYEPMAAGGVRFDDPALAIDWPLPLTVISEKDRSWPDFVDSRHHTPAATRG
jgi:dTDP-4-dehydrorhamnose 3,5-epimerase